MPPTRQPNNANMQPWIAQRFWKHVSAGQRTECQKQSSTVVTGFFSIIDKAGVSLHPAFISDYKTT